MVEHRTYKRRHLNAGIYGIFFLMYSESIEWYIEGQAFSPSYFVPNPPPPDSKLDRRHTGRLRKRDNLLTGEGGWGWVRSRIIRPQENLVLYKSVNTLWLQLSIFHSPYPSFYLSISLFVVVSCCLYCQHVRSTVNSWLLSGTNSGERSNPLYRILRNPTVLAVTLSHKINND